MDWIQALVVGLPATITAAGAVYLSWLNLRKIEANTVITKTGTTTAITSAKAAAVAANNARMMAEDLSKQFNGDLDKRMAVVVKQYTDLIVAELRAHAEKDEENIRRIEQVLNKISSNRTP